MMFNKNQEITNFTNRVLPEKRQVLWQETDFVAHLFFNLNTFVCAQEGTGKTEAQAFYPIDIDIPSWVKTCKEAGMGGIIISAKHHDGFLIWQSDVTDYCLKKSPYLDGKGDIMRELSEECKKEGIKLGISFSLEDKHAVIEGKDADEVNLKELEELLTNYGEIYEVKLDYFNKKYSADELKKYIDLIRRLQPNAVISNGIDARHLGNRKAICRKEEWSVVEPVSELQKIVKLDSAKPATFRRPDGEGEMQLDLGSLKALKKANSLAWQPMYADYSMRETWFYDKEQDRRTMFLHELKDLYFKVVGSNGVLQLGVPIDQRGKIHEEETLTLKSFGIDMGMLKANPASKTSKVKKGENEIVFTFDSEKIIKMIELGENIERGQHIEEFSVYTLEKGKYKKAETHTAVGAKKLILPKKPMVTQSVKIVINKTRGFYDLKTCEIYTN